MMNIEQFTEAQKKVITTLDSPLFVAAGAGSGKTFTLKLRTAYAFQVDDPELQLTSIQEVLAITYTDKAASELLSRIKDTLLAEGLTDQAFECEQAWISTIHGFCSRLLKENALEIGLDPDFKLINELQSHNFSALARNKVVKDVLDEKIDISPVAWNWNLMGSGEHNWGMLEEADALWHLTKALPNGFDSFTTVAADFTPVGALESLCQHAQEVVEGLRFTDKLNQRDSDKLVLLGDALAQGKEWLANCQQEQSRKNSNPASVFSALAAFPYLTKTFGAKVDSTEADAIEAYKVQHAAIMFDIVALFGTQAAEVELQLAQSFKAEYTRLKQEAGVLDNDDLLHLTLDALRNHPFLVEKCKKQFRLIMVDEFQDTDKVQIEILSLISHAGFSNVCVVGDAQQSIYGFRGADVRSFFDYKKALQQQYSHLSEDEFEDQLSPKLADNFRSHSDILKFVDTVFSQACAFEQDGIDYLQLEPKGKVNNSEDHVFDDTSRVSLDFVHYKTGDEGKCKEIAYRESAKRIAEHFLNLKKAYEAVPSQGRQTYALLLGSTTNAQIYIDAFRAVGLESMMTAGSILLSSYEAIVLRSLLHFALNPQDDEALITLLTSHLFSVSDDALYALARFKKSAHSRRKTLSSAFSCVSLSDLTAFGVSPLAADALLFAQQCLQEFASKVSSDTLSTSIRHLFARVGYLDSVVHESSISEYGSVGNYAKLLDLLELAEAETSGLYETVALFNAKLNLGKEAPGILALDDADFIQIMTIHGSKGLQFDHVVLAEVRKGDNSNNNFLGSNEGLHTYSISKKGISPGDACLTAYKQQSIQERKISELSEAQTAGDLYFLLKERAKADAAAEARRLLYVGMTRAVKSLYVNYVTSSNPNSKTSDPFTSDGILQNVYSAFEWGKLNESNPYLAPRSLNLIEDHSHFTYGGSRPLSIRVEFVCEQSSPTEKGELFADSDLVQTCTHSRAFSELPYQKGHGRNRDSIRSYSALRHAAKHGQAQDSSLSHNAIPVPENAQAEDSHAKEANLHQVSSSFTGFGEEDEQSVLVREIGEDATALGSAFHHLAQLAIIQKQKGITQELAAPSQEFVQAQCTLLQMSNSQKARLTHALQAWFESDIAHKLASYTTLAAEVPFMVNLTDKFNTNHFLEGEIDALGIQGTHACIVDYKTGGSASETKEEVFEKHLFQAQCYAYALLAQGFESVEATFVRVEQASREGALQSCTYEFNSDDAEDLKQLILQAWNA